MSFAGFGRSEIPFDMLAMGRHADEARRFAKLGAIYHRGQDLAWDGRAVLAELVEKHGGIRLDDARRRALSRLFGIIMWGELAAWKISAQLADRLEPLEAKLAATSQAHDEARHFYVMHDYLRLLGFVPTTLDRFARVPLDLVLETDDLAAKLLGMQLQVETLALTIFQAIRETRVEPVLADLLLYFEKDEARHVGLGVQLLPSMLRRKNVAQGLRLLVFQLQVIFWSLAELKALEPDMRVLGLDPRRIMTLGKQKQLAAYEQLWALAGAPPTREPVSRFIDGVCELVFPAPETAPGIGPRLRAAFAMARTGRTVAPASLD
ncbi:MAG: ferritin-like domain-containing protein [Myxococcota bacterium]